MTCEQLVELVTDYLDGALIDTDRVRFEEHIAECPMCEAHVERLRGLIRELRALHQRDIDRGVLAAMQASFRGRAPGR